MACMPKLAFLLACICFSEHAFASKDLETPVSVFWGQCKLETDPKLAGPFSSRYLALCIRPESHQSISAQQSNNISQYDHYSRIYAAIHTPGNVAFHWSAFIQGQTDDGPGSETKITRQTDTAALSIGKLGLNRFLLSTGKQTMAFGLGIKPKGAFFESLSSPEFWKTPGYSATVSWDNLVDATGQISVGIADPEELLFLEREFKNLSISSRIIYDSPAWFGTRFVLSGLAHHNGERRLGLGMLNIAPNGAMSLIEWVRSRQTPDGTNSSFKQIIRFTLIGEKQWKKKPFFIYDDVRHTHRLFVIGQEFYFYKNMSVRMSFAYRKDESDEREHLFYGIGGLSLQL